MATKTTATTVFVVKVKDNDDFCGIGAGGAQFAQGKATITNKRLANWFKEHAGYVVEEVKDKTQE